MSILSSTIVNHSPDTSHQNIPVFPTTISQIKSMKDMHSKLEHIVNEKSFRQAGYDHQDQNNTKRRVTTESSYIDYEEYSKKPKKKNIRKYLDHNGNTSSQPQLKTKRQCTNQTVIEKARIRPLSKTKNISNKHRSSKEISKANYNERFKDILLPRNYRAIYESYEETRQANLPNFGVERTPYYKKFVKKPAIEKIQYDRNHGKRNVFKERLLVDTLSNRVRENFEPQGKGDFSPIRKNPMSQSNFIKLQEELSMDQDDPDNEIKNISKVYKNFNRGFTMLDSKPIKFETQIASEAEVEDRQKALMASKNRYVKNSEMGLQQKKLDKIDEMNIKLSFETVKKNYVNPSCLPTTMPYLKNYRKLDRLTQPMRISSHLTNLIMKANDIPEKKKWWEIDVSGNTSFNQSNVNSANISKYVQKRASALRKVSELSYPKGSSYLLNDIGHGNQ